MYLSDFLALSCLFHTHVSKTGKFKSFFPSNLVFENAPKTKDEAGSFLLQKKEVVFF